jgi:hypothetical protein
MGCLPSASKEALPRPYQQLMSSSASPIFDFYPVDFEVRASARSHASELWGPRAKGFTGGGATERGGGAGGVRGHVRASSGGRVRRVLRTGGRPSEARERGGVGGSPLDKPEILPASGAKEQQRILLLARFARAPSSPRFCDAKEQQHILLLARAPSSPRFCPLLPERACFCRSRTRLLCPSKYWGRRGMSPNP